jgi:hypothetical protein
MVTWDVAVDDKNNPVYNWRKREDSECCFVIWVIVCLAVIDKYNEYNPSISVLLVFSLRNYEFEISSCVESSLDKVVEFNWICKQGPCIS